MQKPQFMQIITNMVLVLLVFMNIHQASACTTFIISGKKTPDGKPVLFKNRDTDNMHNALVYFNDGKYKYIGLVDGNDEWDKMVWAGYNEAGFAIMNSAAYNNNVGDTSLFKDQEGIIMKRALQTCRSLQDFEQLLRKLPKPMGLDANFGVIDALGGAAYYETGNYDFTKYDANDPTIAPDGILIRTNHSLRADPKEGFGFCRFNTATESLVALLKAGQLTPQALFRATSRNLYHSLTKTDLSADLPVSGQQPDFRFFIDYIPRESTASAMMIVGVKDGSPAKDIMSWTILGFPLTSVTIPVWISGGENLPRVVLPDKNMKSPICTASLALKDQCFPIKHDRGWNYINLSVVINKEKTGFMQRLEPLETEIFKRAELLQRNLNTGTSSVNDISRFYTWLDEYLDEQFKSLFNLYLF